jgi:hypothetical protein
MPEYRTKLVMSDNYTHKQKRNKKKMAPKNVASHDSHGHVWQRPCHVMIVDGYFLKLVKSGRGDIK